MINSDGGRQDSNREVVGDFQLPQPEVLTNEQLLQFNQHILLTVQAVQALNRAFKVRFS